MEETFYDIIGNMLFIGDEAIIESGSSIFKAKLKKFTHQSLMFETTPTGQYPKVSFKRYIRKEDVPFKVFKL